MKKIIKYNGNYVLNIDGKIINPIGYMSYLPKNADYEEFYNNGYKLFFLCVYMGDGPINYVSNPKPFDEHIWKSQETYDFSGLDKHLSKLIKDKDVYIVLRMNVNAPMWWIQENPNEVLKTEVGETRLQSVFSEKWKAEVKKFFDKLKQYIQTSKYRKNIVGIHIAGMQTEEWLAPLFYGKEGDYSNLAQKAFQRYLIDKYESIEKLNKSWNENYSNFLDIEIPSQEERNKRHETDIIDEQKHKKVLDYYKFFNDSYAETIEEYCKYIKDIFNKDILVGAFSGYIGQLSINFGHSSIDKLLQSSNIDFFASPFPYHGARKEPIDWFYHSAMSSAKQYGKAWFLEADIRTYKTDYLFNVAPEIVAKENTYFKQEVFLGPQTERESIWHIIKAFGKVLCSSNAFWWFDMWGKWYSSINMMTIMKRAKEEYDRFINIENNYYNEIAVILDNNTGYKYSDKCFYSLVVDQLIELGFIGAPYDLYLKNLVNPLTLSKYKFVFFIAPYEIEEKDKLIIKQLQESNIVVEVTGESNSCRCIDRQYIRELCKKSGVHLFIEKDLIVYNNDKFLCVTAPETGVYNIKMKKDCILKEFATGGNFSTKGCKLSINIEKNQTILFEIIE